MFWDLVLYVFLLSSWLVGVHGGCAPPGARGNLSSAALLKQGASLARIVRLRTFSGLASGTTATEAVLSSPGDSASAGGSELASDAKWRHQLNIKFAGTLRSAALMVTRLGSLHTCRRAAPMPGTPHGQVYTMEGRTS